LPLESRISLAPTAVMIDKTISLFFVIWIGIRPEDFAVFGLESSELAQFLNVKRAGI
jgi:hypothetical protein